jgi:hypothetical protein
MELKVKIPEEEFIVIKFEQDEHVGIASINIGLKEFGQKIVFAWHLSIMIQLDEMLNNGMPTQTEFDLVDRFESRLSNIFNVDDNKPNALYLARVTWNKTIELIWRIYEPEDVNKDLSMIIANKEFNRSFDYRIDMDKDWELAEWHLTQDDD